MTAQSFMDMVQFRIFISEWVDGRNKLYLCEFLFVSFYFYLRSFVFVCRRKVLMDNSPVFHGCGRICIFITKGAVYSQIISL